MVLEERFGAAESVRAVLAEQLEADAAGVPAPKMSAVPAWLLRVVGVFSGETRELAETSYMFTKPFVLESTHSEDLLGLSPTPLEVSAKATVDWWRDQSH